MSHSLPGGAVVLAGGEGRRLGRRKESIEIAGRTLLERHLARWLPLFEKVWISSRSPLEAELPAGVETLLDPPGAESLIDVLPALFEHAGEAFFLIAVDLPFLPPEIPIALSAAHTPGRSVFPAHEDGTEVLAAIYDPSALETIEELRDSNQRALHKIAARAPTTKLRYPDQFPAPIGAAREHGPFFNMNTPEDLAIVTAALHAEEAS